MLIFSGIALNAVAASLIFQPAMWHSKNNKVKGGDKDAESQLMESQKHRNKELDMIMCDHCQNVNKKMPSIFSSQYLYNVDDSAVTGYEIIDPGTPMMALANDGWFSGSGKRSLYGSKNSLSSQRKEFDSRKASNQNLVMSNRPSYVNLGELADKKRDNRSIKNFKIEEHDAEDCPSQKAPHDLTETEKILIPKTVNIKSILKSDSDANNNQNNLTESKYILDNESNRSLTRVESMAGRRRSNTFTLEKETLKAASHKLQQYIDGGGKKSMKMCTCDDERRLFLKAKEKEELLNKEYQQFFEEHEQEREYTFWEKFVIFFDLDLLRDFTFVNLMIGVTIANFAELNFSILTPFVLGDFGFDGHTTATLMSVLGSFDIVFRFFVPFIAGRIGWQNKTFFLVGIGAMAMGRVGNDLFIVDLFCVFLNSLLGLSKNELQFAY